MNRLQYLLTMLSEEADEIGKLCAKSQRFGLNSVNPETGLSNHLAMHLELNDLMAIVGQLNKEFNLGFVEDENLKEAKIKKMAKYEEFSIQEGFLDNGPVPSHMYPSVMPERARKGE